MVFIPRRGLLSDNISGWSLSKAGMRGQKAPRHRRCFAMPKLLVIARTTSYSHIQPVVLPLSPVTSPLHYLLFKRMLAKAMIASIDILSKNTIISPTRQ